MNRLTAAMAVTFAVVGLISGFSLYRTAVSYDTATDAVLQLSPGMVTVEEVRIPPINDTDRDVAVLVVFNVTNPTRTPITLTSISFKLYNDDVDDPRDLTIKLKDRYVYLGIAQGTGPIVLEPGEATSMEGTVVVGVAGDLDVLRTTDANGHYHPIITARMLVELHEFGIKRDMRGIFYSSNPEGVPPYEG